MIDAAQHKTIDAAGLSSSGLLPNAAAILFPVAGPLEIAALGWLHG